MDNDISYSSIEEMNTALVRREISPRALYDYHTADQLFINEGRSTVSYRNTIKAKLIILAMEEGISVETQSDSV